MARGKRLSYGDKIQRLREEIEQISDRKQTAIKKYDNEIKDVKAQIAALLDEQKEAKKNELFEKIEASGKSIEEILAHID